ncbi:MAG: hypothetical protein GVY36_03820 [Verrucomicrobia bacterium]|jgi:hypothetical protein|nr:hypothetical protein [Verrucomicrobiota bacterium]
MKAAITLFFLLVIGGIGFYVLRGQVLNFPVQMEITNSRGDTLDASVYGRDDSEVFFKLKGKNKMFEYPLSKLGTWTRLKLYLYPQNRSSSTRHSSSTRQATDQSLSSIHRSSMVEHLNDLRRDRKVLEKKLNAVPSKAEKQTVKAELDLLELNIKRLEYRIERFDRDRGN